MNKMKLHAKLIDLGVVSDEDVVVIKQTNDFGGIYITVVSGLGDTVTYIFHNNEFSMLEGKAHVNDIEKLKGLDMEEYL